ncbi:zinc ribbon domain-containing protein [Methylobacterium sp. NPDC080182]|uniref:zinc ribbon domain-containing protein n=1 Tax=Methylobacterium sp. NPDC080182 TaxID=3390590 RepID=UPI003D0295F3
MVDATRHAPVEKRSRRGSLRRGERSRHDADLLVPSVPQWTHGAGRSQHQRWTCSDCGSEHDRDQSAARNIARLGCETPSPAGHGSLAF